MIKIGVRKEQQDMSVEFIKDRKAVSEFVPTVE